jgi:hypothetical protein
LLCFKNWLLKGEICGPYTATCQALWCEVSATKTTTVDFHFLSLSTSLHPSPSIFLGQPPRSHHCFVLHLFGRSPTLTYFPNLPSKMAELRRKLVIVGDGACGKTCLLMYVFPKPRSCRVFGGFESLMPQNRFADVLCPVSFPREPSQK